MGLDIFAIKNQYGVVVKFKTERHEVSLVLESCGNPNNCGGRSSVMILEDDNNVTEAFVGRPIHGTELCHPKAEEVLSAILSIAMKDGYKPVLEFVDNETPQIELKNGTKIIGADFFITESNSIGITIDDPDSAKFDDLYTASVKTNYQA